jgi:hypothetical protein
LFELLHNNRHSLLRATLSFCVGMAVAASIANVYDRPIIGIASALAVVLAIRAVSNYEKARCIGPLRAGADNARREPAISRTRFRRSLLAIVLAPLVGVGACAIWYAVALLFGNHLALLNFRSDCLNIITLFFVGGLVTSVVLWIISGDESRHGAVSTNVGGQTSGDER